VNRRQAKSQAIKIWRLVFHGFGGAFRWQLIEEDKFGKDEDSFASH
jgi:hypothetical protein